MSNPSVAAVIGSYRTAHLLPPCVETLRAQTRPPAEIVVVDGHSGDESQAVAAALGVRYLRLPRNLGLAASYQAGAAWTASDYLFFVNADMEFEPACLAELVQALEAAPEAFAADPTQLSWRTGQVIHARTVLRRVGRLRGFAPLPGVAPDYTVPAGDVTPVPWGCAGSLLVRRQRLELLGGWDTALFIDCEDIDLCLRAWTRGWPVLYVPAARLRHHVGASLAGARGWSWARQRRLVSQHYNLQRIALKLFGAAECRRVMAVQAIRAAHYALTGPRLALLAWAQACSRLLRDRQTITQEGRALAATAVAPAREVVQRFIEPA